MRDQPINLIEPRGLNEPKRFKRKVVIFLLILLILTLGSAFTVKVKSGETMEYSTENREVLKPRKLGLLQIVKNFIFPPDAPLIGEGNDRINILLLGMGGPGHDGPYLTDTNIIMSVRPSAREVALVSVPRDLTVRINGYGYHRINYANSYGETLTPGQGGDYARKIFAETFDLDIPYYVRVDFDAFKEIIDTVGGVEINVPNSFTDYSYPGPNKFYRTVSFQAGMEKMTGERALIYARSRHGNNGEGSDFARARRQQKVLSALRDKVLSAGTYLNPLRINKILASLNKHISANLDMNQMMTLARIAKEMDDSVKTLVLDNSANGFLVQTRSPEGAYLLAPRGGNFDIINHAIDNVFSATSTTTTVSNADSGNSIRLVSQPVAPFPKAMIEIQNGTWRVGLAMRAKERVEQAGFFIYSIGNSLRRPIAETVIYRISPNISQELLSSLSKTLNAPVSAQFPDWLNPDYDDPATPESEAGIKYKEGTEALVVLGENARE